MLDHTDSSIKRIEHACILCITIQTMLQPCLPSSPLIVLACLRQSFPQLCQASLQQTRMHPGCLKTGINCRNIMISHKDFDCVHHLVFAEFTICLQYDGCPCKRVLRKPQGRGRCCGSFRHPFHLEGLSHAGERRGHFRHPLTSR